MTAPAQPGKSAQAVGQLAKAAVADAKAAGADMPKNAQGVAASAIARGADPSSDFAALVTPDPVMDDSVPTDDMSAQSGEDTASTPGDEATGATSASDSMAIATAEQGYAAAAEATGATLTKDDAEIALALLTEAA